MSIPLLPLSVRMAGAASAASGMPVQVPRFAAISDANEVREADERLLAQLRQIDLDTYRIDTSSENRPNLSVSLRFHISSPSNRYSPVQVGAAFNDRTWNGKPIVSFFAFYHEAGRERLYNSRLYTVENGPGPLIKRLRPYRVDWIQQLRLAARDALGTGRSLYELSPPTPGTEHEDLEQELIHLVFHAAERTEHGHYLSRLLRGDVDNFPSDLRRTDSAT